MKTICPICGAEFEKVNGTSTYCPNKNCRKVAKRARQKIVDDLIKSFRKGIYDNFKLFSEQLANKSDTSIELNKAILKGFDENAYYKTAKDFEKDLTWHFCGNYIFSIQDIEGTKHLVIYKN